MMTLSQNSDLDDLDRPVWGAQEIGRIIVHLLETGRIPGSKVGRQWVTTKRRLRDHFAGQAAG